MNKTELKSWPLHAGRTDWNPVKKVGKSWHQAGTFVSFWGICNIMMEPRFTIISTVAGGREYKLTIQGPVTPRGVSVRCGKLLKRLNQENA